MLHGCTHRLSGTEFRFGVKIEQLFAVDFFFFFIRF